MSIPEQNRWKVMAGPGLVAVLCLCLMACGDTARKDEPQGKRILYYPLANTYFDQDRERYYWLDTATYEWTRRDTLPAALRDGLGRSISIPNPPVPVYRDNAQHRLIYGTALYSTKTDLERKLREDSLADVARREAIRKAQEAEQKPKEKERTKVGKWLRRVFGKKED
ncbi:hypothetical protein [Flaviaesturariibacter amylovorans]|uniref:DUF3997 domain-containing protein n=1 Tax=Flaviaesturariibacter amylovorans TaxID=1084520 RepID=A0ABP8GK92_9BACT